MGTKLLSILSLLALISLSACKSDITCDPSQAKPSGSPGCPISQVCDPTGVCRETCTTSASCDDGMTCDVAGSQGTNAQTTRICQVSCIKTADCLAGQICVVYRSKPPTGTSDDSPPPSSYQLCRLECPEHGSPPSECNSSIGFSCHSCSTHKFCGPRTTSGTSNCVYTQ